MASVSLGGSGSALEADASGAADAFDGCSAEALALPFVSGIGSDAVSASVAASVAASLACVDSTGVSALSGTSGVLVASAAGVDSSAITAVSAWVETS